MINEIQTVIDDIKALKEKHKTTLEQYEMYDAAFEMEISDLEHEIELIDNDDVGINEQEEYGTWNKACSGVT